MENYGYKDCPEKTLIIAVKTMKLHNHWGSVITTDTCQTLKSLN